MTDRSTDITICQVFIERTHTDTLTSLKYIYRSENERKKKVNVCASRSRRSPMDEEPFDDDSRPMLRIRMIKSSDSRVSTKAVNFVGHLTRHLYRSRNCDCRWWLVARVRAV
jgi:hypothetical protein